MKRTTLVLIVALVLVLAGSLIAYLAQTSGGSITVRDVRFVGTNGTMMSGLLYIPDGVSNENPAPGVLAIHGYINSRETQDGFAIEFARRGYVTLALDQTGHGYSEPPAFANGFGGPDGLAYLRSLDIVDKDNIGISGHSMGGWAVLAAAATYPDDYKAIILEGSSTGQPFGGSAEFPRNLAVIFSEWDEFAAPMWGGEAYYNSEFSGVEVAADIVDAPKLQTVFGTEETVVVEQLYGDIEEGTARMLYMPRTTHPGDHISREAISNAIEWFGMTLEGANDLAPGEQVWMWREIGGFIAFIGLVMFMFPFGAMLLETNYFKELVEPVPEFKGLTGWGWWVGALLTAGIPIVTYYWFQNQAGDWFNTPSAFWPQNITTGLVTWALGNGVISLVLFLIWHFALNKNQGATAANYGLLSDGSVNIRKIGKSLLLAICIIFPAYMLLSIADWLFKIDFRLWVLALKLMSARHFGIMLAYLPFFTVFFLILSMTVTSQLRRVDAEGKPIALNRSMLINPAILAVGFVVLLLIQYVPLLTGGTMPLEEPLLTIVAIQIVPLMIIVGTVITYFFRKTGRVYTGAFLISIFITWYIVAGQAIHWAF